MPATLDEEPPLVFARATGTSRPAEAPGRRAVPGHAWSGPWSASDAPSSEVLPALAAGDPRRWAEVTRWLSDPSSPWRSLVWYTGHGPSIAAALATLPPPRLDAVLGSASPLALGSLTHAEALAPWFLAPEVPDARAVSFCAARPEAPVPWARVVAVASAPAWSATWADAVDLLATRSADAPELGGLLAAHPSTPPPVVPPEASPEAAAFLAHLAATTRDDAQARTLARLLRAGLLAGDDVGDDAARTPLEVLVARGRVHDFDPETDQWPNHHDALLHTLAALAPALAGVLFEEVPPPSDDEPPAPGQLADAYRLRAWHGDTCWELVAGDTSDWQDVGAVVGLLNTVARALGAADRFLELPHHHGRARVVCAPEAAIRRAVDEGLLPGGGAGDAVAVGRAAERAALGERCPPELRVAHARAAGRSEVEAVLEVVQELVAEGRRRTGATRDLDARRTESGWEVYWVRRVVARAEDPERELSLDEAAALHPSDWAVGDELAVPLDPWWWGPG